MEKGFFITGTDTNVGKTWVTVGLMHYFKNRGRSVIGLKPVASGCTLQDGNWVNEDALLLQKYASTELTYGLVNPYAYEPAISPHIAGKANPADFKSLLQIFERVKALGQVVLVEGAGGWYSPLNDYQDNSDLALLLNIPVILVVAIKLGCINHVRLTHEAILNKGLSCAGWIAVSCDSGVLYQNEIVQTIANSLMCPCLGRIPFMAKPDFTGMASYFVVD